MYNITKNVYVYFIVLTEYIAANIKIRFSGLLQRSFIIFSTHQQSFVYQTTLLYYFTQWKYMINQTNKINKLRFGFLSDPMIMANWNKI